MLSDDAPARIAKAVEPGTLIGRYRVGECLGVGGMGVVYRARDVELQRDVALKVMRAEQPALLRREAQALARVAHPNVVAVYDVGVFDSQTYIAMEFVRGTTLARWLQSRPRSLDAILEAFFAAARGLGAVHEAGLVHRDFKPSNVLVGDDGRVRISDFGLALFAAARVADELRAVPQGRTEAAGTLSYMSPEQHDHQEVEVPADVFSYCVALFEAVYARRPYGDVEAMQLRRHKAAGRFAEPPETTPDGTPVPKRVRRAIARGLSPDPAARFGSVSALLRALGGGPRRRWPALWRAGAIASGLVVAVLILPVAEEEACRDSDSAADAVAQARPDIRAAFESAAGLGRSTLARVEPALDRFALRWDEAKARACRDGPDAPSVAAHRCLRRHRVNLDATLGVMVVADAAIVARAVQAVDSLPDPATCVGADETSHASPEQEHFAEELARVDALGHLGQLEAALAAIEPLIETAAHLTPRLEARALAIQGRLLAELGSDEAPTVLERVYGLASAADDQVAAAEAAIELVQQTGAAAAQFERSDRWRRHAEAAIERLGGAPALQRRLQLRVAHVLKTRGRFAEAARTLEAAERSCGGDCGDLTRATVHHEIGVNLYDLGRFDEARIRLQQALALRRDELGDEHPNVARTLLMLGNLEARGGDADAAREHLLSVERIASASMGPRAALVAKAVGNRGNLEFRRGAFAEAERAFVRALDIVQDTLGPDHPELAPMLTNLGNAQRHQDKLDEAERSFSKALAILEGAVDGSHPAIATTLNNYGGLRRDQGRYADARALHGRALKILEKSLEPDHPRLAYSLLGMGEAFLADGRAADAVAPLERALRIRDKAGLDALEIGLTRFVLAQAVAPRDRKRAEALAAEARAEVVSAGPVGEELVAEIDAWSASR